MSRRRPLALVLSALVVTLVLLAPSTAHAMTFRQGGRSGTVVVGPNETIDDDLYIVGNTIDVRGTVRGTVFAVGNTVSIEGSVTGDVWAAGNSVRVAGDTGGTVHAAGDEVSVTGRTRGDVTLAGNTILLSSDAVIGRDAALAGNEVSVDGRVSRNVFAGASRMTIIGEVGGDVNAGVQQLTLTDGSSIRGDLRYTSNNQANIEKGATVGGRIVRREPTQVQQPSLAARAFLAFIFWLRRLIGLILFGLIVALAFPRFTDRAAGEIRGRPLPALGIGFAVLIGVPWAALFAFVVGLLIGGWWIAVFAIALYAIAIAVATIVSAVFLGRAMLGAASRRAPQVLPALLIGLLVITIAETVPVLNVLVRLAEVVFGLGAVTLALLPRRPQPVQQPAGYGQPPMT